MSGVWPYVAALIPSAGVGFLFWLVIKNMIEGDRRERLAQRRWEAEQDRAEQLRSARPAADSAGAQGSVPERTAAPENTRNHRGEPIL